MRWLLIFGSFLLALFLAGAGAHFWRARLKANRTNLAFERTRAALDHREYQRALLFINSRPPTDKSEELRRWADLEVECGVQLGLINRLDSLHRFQPQAVLANEKACLLLARAAVHLDQPERADLFADAWRDRSKNPNYWTCFDADRLTMQGKSEAAIRLLEANRFEGAHDCGRLVRLAAMTAGADFKAAWNLLAEAYTRNPRNAEVRLYRGQVLERAGQLRFARVEFEAAHFADTNNPIYRDTLGEFYRRQGNLAGALDVWGQSLTNDTAGFLWTKALFWNRVTRGADLPAYTVTNRSSVSFHFNRYLSALPADRFWDGSSFDLLPHQALISTRQQEAWWLQILEMLREGKERAALDRLIDNPWGERVWNPAMYSALTRVLNFRRFGDLNPAQWFPPDAVGSATNGHSFLAELEVTARKRRVMRELFTIPRELEGLMKSPDAVGVVLLSGGWFKAGLDLLKTERWPNELPAWAPYSVTQAKRLVEGNAAALEYALKQRRSTALTMAIGELQIAAGKVEEGDATLASMVKLRSPVGRRSAWVLANARLQLSKPADAKAVVEAQPLLRDSTEGRELLARIAIAQGDAKTATEIYESIVDHSLEARAILARAAYASQDYARAKKLTEELQYELPDALKLRANLNAIRQAAMAK